ncbi:hypothetical protein SAMN02745165_00766 [Malonomonas rubra DSM 5091]|uniref:Uncharacterized protein n=1 Tax=Malonomonas rubra DSM 5091 TaxID=1122189 RepID=A0A1M6DPZ0_MALRU|nr:hypothetical protein [Malonomonas rubra]SHI75287.1 hypothetical protein SAMN02745165_00766 [Malonomonas rubra DSM 5091]
MERNRFLYLCSEATSGGDAFVRHPGNREEGLITSCSLDTEQMMVKTPGGEVRVWDYRECDDLQRPRLNPFVWDCRYEE